MLTDDELRLRAYAIVLYAAMIVMSVLAPPTRVTVLGVDIALRSLLFAPPFLMLVLLFDRYGIALLGQMIRIGYFLLLFALGASLLATAASLNSTLALAIIGIAVGLALSHAAALGICVLGGRSMAHRAVRFIGAPQMALLLTYGCLILFILPALPPIPHLWQKIIVTLAVLMAWNLLLSLIALGAVLTVEGR